MKEISRECSPSPNPVPVAQVLGGKTDGPFIDHITLGQNLLFLGSKEE